VGTANFMSHENGIFVIEDMDFQETKDYMIESFGDDEFFSTYYDEDTKTWDIPDETIWEEIGTQQLYNYEDFFNNVSFDTKLNKYYDIQIVHANEMIVKNKQGKLVAVCTIQSGYYEHLQVIVETNPDNLEAYLYSDESIASQYTPNHARLLNIISNYTTPLVCIARASNGEAFYSRVA
jgi:hypothetical protein